MACIKLRQEVRQHLVDLGGTKPLLHEHVTQFGIEPTLCHAYEYGIGLCFARGMSINVNSIHPVTECLLFWKLPYHQHWLDWGGSSNP